MEFYIIIGVIVYICIFYKFAYHYANSSKGSMSGHPVNHFKDRGIEPGIGDYICTLLWGPALVMLWPLILLYYVFIKKD